MKCLAFSFAVVLFAVFMAYTSASTTSMMMMMSSSTSVMTASTNTTHAAVSSSAATHMTAEPSITPTSSAVNFAPSVLAMAVALLFATLK